MVFFVSNISIGSFSPKNRDIVMKKFADGYKHLSGGLKKYKAAVERGSFPDAKHYTKLSSIVLKELSESS